MEKRSIRPIDYTGSSFESFLEEEGILEEVDAAATQRVLDWQREASNEAPQGQETSERQIAIAQDVMRERREVLRRLAK